MDYLWESYDRLKFIIKIDGHNRYDIICPYPPWYDLISPYLIDILTDLGILSSSYVWLIRSIQKPHFL